MKKMQNRQRLVCDVISPPSMFASVPEQYGSNNTTGEHVIRIRLTSENADFAQAVALAARAERK